MKIKCLSLVHRNKNLVIQDSLSPVIFLFQQKLYISLNKYASWLAGPDSFQSGQRKGSSLHLNQHSDSGQTETSPTQHSHYPGEVSIGSSVKRALDSNLFTQLIAYLQGFKLVMPCSVGLDEKSSRFLHYEECLLGNII